MEIQMLDLDLAKGSLKRLMVRGNKSLIHRPGIAIVGSRKASPKGLEVARDCASQIAVAGLNVVSGYAAGVDLTSHIAALRAGGTTTIVLAEGIQMFKIKREMSWIWDWERIAVVSEWPANACWTKQQALARNATICDLSQAVIVAQAKKISGTMNTGRTCLKQQKPLFASYMEEGADGNLELLAKGARPIYKSRLHNRANLDAVFEVMTKGVAA